MPKQKKKQTTSTVVPQHNSDFTRLSSIILPLSWAYLLGQKVDAALRKRKAVHSQLPVISVGNLSAGGTGKTPLCIYLLEQLQNDHPCILLSRGYGRQEQQDILWNAGDPLPSPDSVGDEPALAARYMRNGALAVSSHRSRLLERVTNRYPDGIVILDDGFQHVQIARDCDIVIVDDRTVDDRPLPVGRLRESPNALARANIILATSERAEEFARSRMTPETLLVRLTFRSGTIRRWNTGSEPESDRTRSVLVTGIARPERVRNSLDRLGVPPTTWLQYADHHRYSRRDVEKILATLKRVGTDRLVTTAKDAVKLECFPELSHVLYVVDLRVEIDREQEFIGCIQSVISKKLSL